MHFSLQLLKLMSRHSSYLSIDVQMLRRCVNIFIASSTQIDDNLGSGGNSGAQLLHSTKSQPSSKQL